MKGFFFLVLFSFPSFAILQFEDATSPELITSARALALGGAYASKVDDSWSAFYNPAGLGTVRGLQLHLTNIHLEMNNGFLDITGGSGSFFESTGNYTGAFEPATLRDLLADNPGEISHVRFQTFPNVTYRGITLGYMYSQQNRGRLKSTSDDFELSERIDSGPVFALSLSLFGGIVKFGGTAIYLTRKQLQKDFTSAESVNIDVEQDYTKGSMVHLTAALDLLFLFL